MPKTTRARESALSGGLPVWRAALTVRRSRTQWRLMAVVLVVAIVSSTLITALALLIASTETAALRGTLATAPADQTQVRVILTLPTRTVEQNRTAVAGALGQTFGSATTVDAVTSSALLVLPRESQLFALGYLGDYDDITEHATVVEGVWPTETSGDAPRQIAVPAAGLAVLGWKLGDTVDGSVFGGGGDDSFLLVGAYEPVDPDGLYWKPDLLDGQGVDPAYPVPGTSGALITDAVGPLVIAPGTVDSTGILIRQSVFRAIPDFSSATIDQLAPLQIRVDAASEAVPFALGPIADFVQVRGNLGHLLATVTSALTVTRGTVLAVSLLLLVLAVTALSQIAQLLTEAREGERHLMRARGASSGQLVALATIEAAVVMALTIAVSPPLAVALSGAVTALSPWASSSRTGSIEVPATLWLTAALVAVIFAVVLILPALRRDGTFHDGEQSKARGGRTSALQRYGIDLVLLVLAAIAFWQLRSYQGTAGVVTALSVDPILVVGPALVLVAGALLCARLVPVAARIAERLAAGSLGVTLPLAAWEISRRAQRVTAAVVLVTLAVATGVFSQAFLATWRQSQVDQAAFALGAPARAVGDVDPESTIPWTPVLRTPASLAGVDAYYLGAESATGVDVTALGLDVDARALLTTVGEGQPGRAIANGLSDSVPASTGIPLPEGTRAIDLQVSVTPTVPLRGIIADLRAVIESPDGSLRSVDIAAVSVNGEEHSTTAVLPEPTGDGESLVAIQATLAGDLAARGNPEGTALLSIRGLAARPEADSAANAVPLVIEDLGAWSAASDSRGASASVTEPDDAQIGVEFAIPVSLNLEPSAIVLMAWPMVDELPIVVSRDLLGTMDAREKDGLTLILGDALMRARVVDSVSGVPGGGDATELDVLTIGTSVRGAVEQTLVVDRTLLGRALAQLGAIEPASTERWSGSGAVSGAADGAATVETLGSLTSSLQDHPVRASIQAALWLVIVGAALLAAIGFATYTTGSLRSRTVEFAQLRAIGLSRGALIRVVTIESLLLSLFGGLAGVGLGVLLGSMVVPLVGSSVDGTPPVPPVAMVIPWSGIALLAVVLIVVLAGVVVVVARMQKTIDPARILREGGDR